MKSRAGCFPELREYVDSLPVIDCHDHAARRERVYDAIQFIARGYYYSDLWSSSTDSQMKILGDTERPLEERWQVLEDLWSRSRYTGYGRMVLRCVEKVFGETDLSLEAIRRMNERLPDYSDPETYDGFYKEAKIAGRILNWWPPLRDVVAKKHEFLPGQYPAIRTPWLHSLKNRQDLLELEEALDVNITSLDEYLEACRKTFHAWKDLGAVAFKDQSAYQRSIAYRNPARAEAESVFNRIISDPRYWAEYDPDGNSLSDFLMHEFMRMARDLDLPVQVHTGHMAGVRNDVRKANASGLRSLMEVHREVRFDLFHANWPYGGDILFLVKNYPNAHLDFCWAHIIDPVYCVRLLKQAVSSVPHGKIHGFGSDVGGQCPDHAWAHCMRARENIATALADLVEDGYFELDDAKGVAADILFNNPNRFFRLGLEMEDCL